jgi:hypothetical protein
VLFSPAVVDLDHATFRLLVLLAAEFTGSNNGALGLTRQQARERGVRSADAHSRGLAELEKRGLIVMTAQAARNPSRPTQYALTWRPLNDTKHTSATRTPSFDYRTWAP